MRIKRVIYGLLLIMLAVSAASYGLALPYTQDDRTRQNNRQQGARGNVAQADTAKRTAVAMPEVIIEDDSIPDSLLHPRWKIQRIVPITQDDLDRGMADLSMPGNISQEVVYNDTLNRYYIGSKMGEGYLSAPIAMTPEEYRAWSEKKEFDRFFRSKNDEIVKEQGKETGRKDIRSRRCEDKDAGYGRTEVWSHAQEHRQPFAAYQKP